MQEEISLREIIETIWNGKIIIISVTVIAMLTAGVLSFFVLSPTYEASATVRVNQNEEMSNSQLNSFTETIKSDVSIHRIIEKLQLNENDYSISSIRNNLTVNNIKDTNVIRLTLKGTDPEAITMITNLLAFEIGARIEITDRAGKIVTARNRLDDINDAMIITQGEIIETENQLKVTPEILITKKTVSDDPYLQSIVNEEQPGTSSRDTGAMSLIHEEINPLYTNLKNRLADATIHLTKLQEERNTLNENIMEQELRIQELEVQIDNEKLKAKNSERLLNGFNAVFISPAIEPQVPTGPNKKLNIAVSAIVGIMVSLVYVFVRHYWRTTSPSSYSANSSMNG